MLEVKHTRKTGKAAIEIPMLRSWTISTAKFSKHVNDAKATTFHKKALDGNNVDREAWPFRPLSHHSMCLQ